MEDMAKLDEHFQNMHTELTSSVRTEDTHKGEQETTLAEATKMIQEAQQLENQASKAHADYLKEYHDTMKKCCDNKNAFLGELCALEKLRGELFKMEGVEATIQDCEVSDWTDAQCTKECEGGAQERTRSVIAHTINGTKCPPMRQD